MKAKEFKLHLLYYLILGISINVTSTAIAKWREVTPQKEGAIIFIDLLCIAINYVIWVKYISKVERLTGNKKLAGSAAMCVGVIIGVGSTLFLQLTD